MKKTQVIRHGDIAFVKVSKIPAGLKKTKTDIIIKNGSGGNPHTFKNGKIYFKKEDEFK